MNPTANNFKDRIVLHPKHHINLIEKWNNFAISIVFVLVRFLYRNRSSRDTQARSSYLKNSYIGNKLFFLFGILFVMRTIPLLCSLPSLNRRLRTDQIVQISHHLDRQPDYFQPFDHLAIFNDRQTFTFLTLGTELSLRTIRSTGVIF